LGTRGELEPEQDIPSALRTLAPPEPEKPLCQQKHSAKAQELGREVFSEDRAPGK